MPFLYFVLCLLQLPARLSCNKLCPPGLKLHLPGLPCPVCPHSIPFKSISTGSTSPSVLKINGPNRPPRGAGFVYARIVFSLPALGRQVDLFSPTRRAGSSITGGTSHVLPRLDDISIDELLELFERGSVTSVELVHACPLQILTYCVRLLTIIGVH